MLVHRVARAMAPPVGLTVPNGDLWLSGVSSNQRAPINPIACAGTGTAAATVASDRHRLPRFCW